MRLNGVVSGEYLLTHLIYTRWPLEWMQLQQLRPRLLQVHQRLLQLQPRLLQQVQRLQQLQVQQLQRLQVQLQLPQPEQEPIMLLRQLQVLPRPLRLQCPVCPVTKHTRAVRMRRTPTTTPSRAQGDAGCTVKRRAVTS
uniref:Uncharacterized protein n=1 Tax=Branchiostoma floridae TaxID=7739 RepID=C3Z6Z8_BRAFL|eukprot:XP_002595582.1 hypothetical protein BRAFLDRAFT_117503 [Branchiostoma floridae]